MNVWVIFFCFVGRWWGIFKTINSFLVSYVTLNICQFNTDRPLLRRSSMVKDIYEVWDFLDPVSFTLVSFFSILVFSCVYLLWGWYYIVKWTSYFLILSLFFSFLIHCRFTFQLLSFSVRRHPFFFFYYFESSEFFGC